MAVTVSSFPAPVGYIGRYAILGRLARGGMAEIYLAREEAGRPEPRELLLSRYPVSIADERPVGGTVHFAERMDSSMAALITGQTMPMASNA